MNTPQAQTFIHDAFTQPFKRDRFRAFMRELLNRLDEGEAFQKNQPHIKDAFKPGIERAERLGKYTDPAGDKLDVYIVYLKRETSLERARTLQRNFVVDMLETRGTTDAALVAFVPPEGADWRFSFIKLEYAAYEQDGTVKTKRVLKSARRFSFLVGAGENSHTAQAQLVGILAESNRNPTLVEIESAFSVERVTDEFFAHYKTLYENAKAALEIVLAKDKSLAREFAHKQVRADDFAKKLLGQIVFLYFLQKKGWLGVARGSAWGSGPRGFLRGLFTQSQPDGRNFFNDVLEPLFYDTLAVDRGNDAWCAPFNCRIPFLNGGLFEPLHGYDWRNTAIDLPNGLFSAPLPRAGEGPGVGGILDIFDLYNFTVNEDEPLEKEVAIDPEMLGKVFENLLNPSERRARGAVYTPREIVHYMCQQSLIHYLDGALNQHEQSLRDLARTLPEQSALFPAASAQLELSGPTRMTQVSLDDLGDFIEHCDRYAHYAEAIANGTQGANYPRPPASIRERAAAIDEALRDITVCDPAIGSGAFPVGMMTEIVRARLALGPYLLPSALTSLPAGEGNTRGIYALKRHAIQNCIYGVDIDPAAVEIAKLRLWLSLVVDEQSGARIAPLPNLDYKIMCGNALIGLPNVGGFKLPKVEALSALMREFFGVTDPAHKTKLRAQIDEAVRDILLGFKTQGAAITFDFRLYFGEVFAGKDGFDVVIGNPPYVRQEAIREFKPALKARYACFTGTADLYVYFYERALQILRTGGVLTFITSNKYFRAGYGEKLRGYLSEHTALHRLIDFGDAPVFEAIAYPSILIATQHTPLNGTVRALAWQADWALAEFATRRASDSFDLPQRELTRDGWRLSAQTSLRLLEKLRTAGKPLGEFVKSKLYYGIKTGLNEAFVVDRATHDRLIGEHASSADVLKPFLRGRDVKRWRVTFGEQYLIKIASSENATWPWSGKPDAEAERVFKHTYPAVYKHFEPLRERLIQREDQGKYFWELRSCAYWQEFEQPKIVIPAIEQRTAYALDEAGYFSNDKTSICVTDQAQYLLGVMNSSVLWWFIRQIASTKQGGFYEFKPMYVSQLPIPAATPAQQSAITVLVARILAAKRANAGADVAVWEREIDQIVYGLYGLTGEEIGVVEGKS